MDQADVNIPAFDSGIVATDSSEEIEDLTSCFDAGIAPADHRETEQTPADVGLCFQVGLLNPADDSRPQEHGIADILHKIGMLGHSRKPAQINLRSES